MVDRHGAAARGGRRAATEHAGDGVRPDRLKWAALFGFVRPAARCDGFATAKITSKRSETSDVDGCGHVLRIASPRFGSSVRGAGTPARGRRFYAPRPLDVERAASGACLSLLVGQLRECRIERVGRFST